MQGVLRLIGDSGKVEVASQCWGSCCSVCCSLPDIAKCSGVSRA